MLYEVITLVLARRFASLDVLSGGRVCVGLGNGWSADEFEAAAVPARGRGRRIDEALAILKAVWTTDPVEFAGEHFRIPRSFIQPVITSYSIHYTKLYDAGDARVWLRGRSVSVTRIAGARPYRAR